MPFFRIVKHRKIKLKKSIRDQLLTKLTFRTTSCLNNCDNYYFSPSQVSLISPLPQFVFKTNFNYNHLKVKNQSKQKLFSPSFNRSEVTQREDQFNSKVKLLLTPFNQNHNQSIHNNICDNNHPNNEIESIDSYTISPLIANNNSINSNESTSFPFFRRRQTVYLKSDQIRSNDNYLPNYNRTNIASSDDYPISLSPTNTITTNISTINEPLLQPTTQKTSTPIAQLNQQMIDVSLSPIIRVNKELGKSFRSIAVEIVPSKMDKTTQTVHMRDKTTQTETQMRDKSFQVSFDISNNSNTNSNNNSNNNTISSGKKSKKNGETNESDSDPESPFPKRLSQEIHHKI